MQLLLEYNTKYLRYTDYNPSATALGKSFYAKYLLLSTTGNDISPKNVPQQHATCAPGLTAFTKLPNPWNLW